MSRIPPATCVEFNMGPSWHLTLACTLAAFQVFFVHGIPEPGRRDLAIAVAPGQTPTSAVAAATGQKPVSVATAAPQPNDSDTKLGKPEKDNGPSESNAKVELHIAPRLAYNAKKGKEKPKSSDGGLLSNLEHGFRRTFFSDRSGSPAKDRFPLRCSCRLDPPTRATCYYYTLKGYSYCARRPCPRKYSCTRRDSGMECVRRKLVAHIVPINANECKTEMNIRYQYFNDANLAPFRSDFK